MTTHTLATVVAGMLFLAVACGAFGAHALQEVLTPEMKAVYQTAVFYHLTHALGALLVLTLQRAGGISEKLGRTVATLLLIGVVIFSGSLYALTLTGITVLGAITPIGGTLFLIGWGTLAWGLWRAK